MTVIDWKYIEANGPFDIPGWTADTGRQVGVLNYLLNAGMHYEEAIKLREITTKARLVSDYLDEVEKRTNGVVSASKQETNRSGA